MKETVAVDVVWIAGILFTIVGLGFGWYIVRLDHHVEKLRDEVIKMEKDIGKLQNADVTCTADQTILKQDMSAIRETLLKVISKRFMRRGLQKAFRDRGAA